MGYLDRPWSASYGPREPPPPPPVEDLYDLLTALVARTPWQSEGEARRYGALIAKLREVNIFGSLATKITTKES